MSSYLPEKTYVVCTNQTGNDYRELVADRDKRKVSVFYKDKRAFLTIVDKKLNEDFTCKTGWRGGLVEAAFIGGVGIASGLAIASIVPVFGWIAGGAVALYAIYSAYEEISNSPKCTGALGNEASQWKLYHPNVRYNKYNAILSRSILHCGEGGILLPFISETAAAKAAKSIGWNNKTDIGLNTVVNGFAGFGIAELLMHGNIGTLLLGVGIGNYLVNPGAEYLGDKYAEKYRDQRYDEIQSAVGKKREENKSFMDYVTGAANPADDVKTLVEQKNKIVEAMAANGASKEAIANFEASVAEAQRTGTLRNPESKKTLMDIKEGKYGSEVKELFTNKSGNARGMHTEKNYDKATKLEQEKIKINRYTSVKSLGKGGITLVGIAQPFISAIFDRKALLLAKEAQESKEKEDRDNSISVRSSNY